MLSQKQKVFDKKYQEAGRAVTSQKFKSLVAATCHFGVPYGIS